MKKIILILGLIFSIHMVTKAQQEKQFITATNFTALKPITSSFYIPTDSTVIIKDYAYYMKKSKNQKIAAFTLLGGGALLTGIGVLTFPKDYNIFGNSSSTENQANISAVIVVVGIAAMAASIPFFISSPINKHRAKLKINNQKTGFGTPPNVSKLITGITLSIPIGK